MPKQLAGFPNGGGLVFLLDVHVERVEVQLKRRTADGFDELEPLIAGVEEICLETVQRFHANLHALLLGVRSKHFEVFHD